MANAKNRSVNADRFSMVPRADIPRSAFDMTHTHKTTFDAGLLVPLYVDEVLPGDTFRVNATLFARLATPIVPVMDNLILESFFFFIPNRLLWTNWERFMGEQLNPTDTTVFLTPQIPVVAADCAIGSMADYFGITVNGGAGAINIFSLPFRAYNLVWNDWFRDEDLQAPEVVQVDDGPDVMANYVVRRRGKRHDYFTSARPWPEKPLNMNLAPGVLGQLNRPGGLGVGALPGQAFGIPATGTGVDNQPWPGIGIPVTGIGVATANAATVGNQTVNMPGGRQVIFADHYDSNLETIFVKGSGAGNAPDVRLLINDLRIGLAVQGMLERNARGGTRYAEIVRAHFGVTPLDARLQRPEYLGGGRSHVTVNPVAQTSATGLTGGTTVLGNLAGIGQVVGNNHGFSQSFTEHGIILGLICVRADMTYQQGVNRMWWRRTQYDFYWPGLAHLGEQAILSKEIYCDTTAGDNDVFGYQERWSEYKYKPSRTSGAFRSTVAAPIDQWHFGQEFLARPTLNPAFIVESPPVNRVLQVAGFANQQFLLDSHFSIRCVRAMPMFSVPGVGLRF